MTPKEHLIESLRELCKREGGHVAVADAIGANEQTLWQVLAGIALPSGEPRGIGPAIQRKLEDKFPGWATKLSPASGPGAWPLPRIPPSTWRLLTERQRGVIEDAAVRALQSLTAVADTQPSSTVSELPSVPQSGYRLHRQRSQKDRRSATGKKASK